MYQHHTGATRHADRRRLWLGAILLLTLVALSILWSMTPLHEVIRPRALAAMVGALADHPAAPWLMLAAFVVGGLVALPVTLMVVLTVVAFGPVTGFLYALTGATLAAIVAFGVGRLLGHRMIERMTGSRIHSWSRRLGEAGIIAVAALRMVPLAHFTIISLAAGSSHLRLSSFTVGTILGMAPGIGVIALMLDRLVAVSAEPGLGQYLLLAGVSLAMLGLLLGTRLLARHVARLLPRNGRGRG